MIGVFLDFILEVFFRGAMYGAVCWVEVVVLVVLLGSF